MDGLTLLDVQPFRSGSHADRCRVAHLMDDACRDTGFLQIVGHGISESVLADMLDVTAEFFDQPLADKLELIVEDLSANRGYTAVGTEALAYSTGAKPTSPDLFEAFNAGRDLGVLVGNAEDAAYVGRHRRFYAPNVWPGEPAEMREVWQRYQGEVSRLTDDLLRASALALGVPLDFFIHRTRRAIVTTRAINYQRPAGAPSVRPGQMRMGPHTDYGVLTVLNADDAPGLEVFNQDRWNPVSVPQGSLIVNIGDMLATWTNDRWVSTLHRVVPPGPDLSGGDARRRSVAQFLEADPDCVISCLPSCTSAHNPSRYEPITAGEYLLAKLMGPRELRVSDR